MFLAFKFRDNHIGFFGHLLINVLALLVVFVDVFSLFERYIIVFFNQKVNTFLSILHASRGIYAWTNPENDVTHRQLSAV